MSMNEIKNAATRGMIEMMEDWKMNPLLIVDASNVAFGSTGAIRNPTLATLAEVLAMLPASNLEIRAIADASLRHKIDRREDYERLVQTGEVLQAPAGRSADQFIAQLARRRKAKGQKVYILTNDLLRQWSDLEQLRVTFLKIGEGEIIFDPPLETLSSNSSELNCETSRAGHAARNTQASGSPDRTIVSQPIYYRGGKTI